MTDDYLVGVCFTMFYISKEHLPQPKFDLAVDSSISGRAKGRHAPERGFV